MSRFALLTAGLFVLACEFAAVRWHPVAAALFPVPVAWCWAQNNPIRALALVGAAAGAALVGAGTWQWVGVYTLAAIIGILLGVAIQRDRSFGQCVALVTATGFLLTGGLVFKHGPEVRLSVQTALDYQATQLEEKAEETDDDMVENQAAVWRWVYKNLDDIGFGVIFGIILMGSTAGMALLKKRLVTRPKGTFREMRPSEWLVWLAIVVAGLWYIDYRWPMDALHLWTRNGAVGLAFIYGVNGLSILVYAIYALKVTTLTALLLLFTVMMLGTGPVLVSLGFFDTWWNFRMKFDRLAKIRQELEKTDSDEK